MERFIAETSFHVRYAETDAMRIVHHSNYIVWFEEGRSHYMRARGTSYADFERDGFFMAVTEVHVRYVKPMHYDERVTVRAWLEQARSRSMTFAYEILNASGEVCVTGQTHHICMTQDGKVARIPPGWLAWMTS